VSDLACSQRCKEFGFENDTILKYFKGGFKPSIEDHEEGNSSLMIRHAKPDSRKVVTTSLFISGDSPRLKYWWKIDGPNTEFFKLSLFIDDKFVENYDYNGNWEEEFFQDFPKNGKSFFILKWVLEYNQDISYLDVIPTADAFIDGLELCDLGFENQSTEDAQPILKNDDLKYLVENSKSKMLDLMEEHDGMIEIAGVKNKILKSNAKAGLRGNGTGFNLILNHCYNVTIEDLYFDGSTFGLCLKDCNNCKIINNKICFSEGWGIVINDSSIGNIISDNQLIRKLNSTLPIFVLENSNNNNIERNSILKDDGYSYVLSKGLDNTISISNEARILYNENDYLACPNSTGKGCFFRTTEGKPPIVTELGPEMHDLNNWYYKKGD